MPRATPMSPADRRAAIVEAVLPLVVERGEMPSTREVAEAAGIAEGTIYRAFDDKDALLHAVVERALAAPPGDEPELPLTRGEEDLHAQVVEMAQQVQGRLRTVSTVLMAVRRQLAADPDHRHGPGPGGPGPGGGGPPAYVVEANQRLLDRLTGVFDAHRDRLRVEPATAALVLRGLVFGSQHPGMSGAGLTPDQIADVVMHGVAHGAAHSGADVPARPQEDPSC